MGVSDAVFRDNLISRYSIEGYLFTQFGGVINWRFIKQILVIKLNIEVEFTALSYAGMELIQWSCFFKGIVILFNDEQTIYCDNLQTI